LNILYWSGTLGTKAIYYNVTLSEAKSLDLRPQDTFSPHHPRFFVAALLRMTCEGGLFKVPLTITKSLILTDSVVFDLPVLLADG